MGNSWKTGPAVETHRVQGIVWGVPLGVLGTGVLGSLREPELGLLSAAFMLGWTQGVGP